MSDPVVEEHGMDWRKKTLPDGRQVELLECVLVSESDGAYLTDVHIAVDEVLQVRRVSVPKDEVPGA